MAKVESNSPLSSPKTNSEVFQDRALYHLPLVSNALQLLAGGDWFAMSLQQSNGPHVAKHLFCTHACGLLCFRSRTMIT